MRYPTRRIGSLVPDVRDVSYAYKDKTTVINAVRGKFCDNRTRGEVVMDKKESAKTSTEMTEYGKKANTGLLPD